ncbi:NAD-dependent succinate-semialdehyde dehydrogenase [Halobacteriales archaeon Cl-PHB]
MESVNPATGDVVASYDVQDAAAVEATLDRAASAFDEWKRRPLRDREHLIDAAGDVLEDRTREFAETMTREMGKPISQAAAEVEKCAWACHHYAEFAGSYLQAEEYPSPPGVSAKTVHEPLGPVLAVMPWNYPLWQVFRFAAPALTAGNVGLLKHAPEVPGCAAIVAEVFEEAGYPEGVFQNLRVEPDVLHEEVLADPRVKAATLTGSGRAGSAVASTAGEHLKKTVLELGGSDPYVVLDDADVEAAATTGAQARMQNTGQSCIAAKRILVHESVFDEFEEQFLAAVDDRTVGDPMDEATDLGPLVSERHLETLDEQVQASVDAGATLLRGGEAMGREGAFYEPTVLTDVPPGCPAHREELFGPVAVLEEVASEDEAVEIANDTNFGLGASVWTEDRHRGEAVARRIDAGAVFVNQLSKSDPRVPFGGIKDSGYGRELSEYGIKEFVNRKTVWVE